MAPTVLTRTPASRDRSEVRHEPGPNAPHDIAFLEANSHRPEVQTLIRDAIRRGKVRVHPAPGCPDRLRIEPTTRAASVRGASPSFRLSPHPCPTPVHPGVSGGEPAEGLGGSLPNWRF